MPTVYVSSPLSSESAFTSAQCSDCDCGPHRAGVDSQSGHRLSHNADSALRAGGVERRVNNSLSAALRLRHGLIGPVLLLPALLAALSGPAAAAYVAFENCLPESYVNNHPTPLQWVPKYVDASFEVTEPPMHTLRVTMWGNVTGAFTNVTLPSPGSPDWTDPTKTDGKILDQPEPNAPNPKLTTLLSKINVLTYEPYRKTFKFCNGSLVNGSCPLAPVFDTNTSVAPYNLPSVNMSHSFDSSYAFASFTATFLIIYGDSKGTNIGCVSATVTPDLGQLAWMIKYLPMLVLVLVGFATVFAGIFSPWGTSDIFHWSSNYGRDPDLLRLVTPGFGDCLQYIQFIVLTGGLTLNYPGFYQPIISQASWSALMFNHSFVSKDPGWISVQDGIYVTEGAYGLQKLARLAGLRNLADIWAGMMVWLLAIIAGMLVVFSAGFSLQWLYRFIQKIPEEDLRSKNIPFMIGNIVRIVLNYFLLPIVALSTFQLVVASNSPAYTVAMAVVSLILIIGFAAWLLYLIATTKPRAFLFDDLPTVLLYGPLYNTYSDEAAAFTLIPVLLTFIRGIAVGAVQPAGVAQVVILAICEVIQILTLHAFRPFHSPTSMNAYHTLFAALRLITVLLMIAFIPSLGVTDGPKGWIGYAILVTHAGVLVLGFLLNAVQTIVEVVARMLGAGGDDIRGQTRGGLSKIFGMRQLSRRMSRRMTGHPSRQSQLSSSAMLDADELSKTGYVMPSGRVRSESAGSMGMFTHRRHRSSSVYETLTFDAAPARHPESIAGSYTPTTPGEPSPYMVLPSPKTAVRPQGTFGFPAYDPYYRPPRQRRATVVEPSSSSATGPGGPGKAGDGSQNRNSVSGSLTLGDASEIGGENLGDATSAVAYGLPFNPRIDYSIREVDFYYRGRGERLNSEAPARKLGTGPADPTGPVASAVGWLRSIFGRRTKDKGKGFEVVRSARMPPAMMRAAGADFEDEQTQQGVPVAMGVLRSGPVDSEDDQEQRRKQLSRSTANPTSPDCVPLNGGRNSGDDDVYNMDASAARPPQGPPILPEINLVDSSGQEVPEQPPEVPRKSSKRKSWVKSQSMVATVGTSGTLSPPPSSTAPVASSRLPFESTPSQKSSADEFIHIDLGDPSPSLSAQGGDEEMPTAYGTVNRGSISRIDHEVDLLTGSARMAEVVDDRQGGVKRPTRPTPADTVPADFEPR